MNSKKKAVFLDRDGTINYDYKYVYKFSNFKFRKNVIRGLKYLCKNKYLIFPYDHLISFKHIEKKIVKNLFNDSK